MPTVFNNSFRHEVYTTNTIKRIICRYQTKKIYIKNYNKNKRQKKDINKL